MPSLEKQLLSFRPFRIMAGVLHVRPTTHFEPLWALTSTCAGLCGGGSRWTSTQNMNLLAPAHSVGRWYPVFAQSKLQRASSRPHTKFVVSQQALTYCERGILVLLETLRLIRPVHTPMCLVLDGLNPLSHGVREDAKTQRNSASQPI